MLRNIISGNEGMKKMTEVRDQKAEDVRKKMMMKGKCERRKKARRLLKPGMTVANVIRQGKG